MPPDTYTLTISDVGVSTPADNSVTSAKIVDGTIVAGDLASNSVTAVKILNANVTADKLALDSVTTDKILNANVTADKLAPDAVTTTKILDANVTADKLALDSVTTTKILDANVTTNKIANNNVTLGKIQQIAANTILCNPSGSPDNVTTSPCGAYGLTLLSKATLEEAKSSLGLGTIATQDADDVTITGGEITGVTLSGLSLNMSSVTGTLSPANGGTGLNAYTEGDLLYANGPTSFGKLSKGGSTLVLHGSGSGSVPTWGLIDLATDVTGTLPTAYGGTGGSTTDTQTFRTTEMTTDALATGELRWNGTDQTLDLKLAGGVTLQVGQETNIYVHASETISNGQVVYIVGANGELPSVALADNSTIDSKKTLGVATQSITNGSKGYITVVGTVRDLNLITILGSGIASGDTIWLGSSGNLTRTEPEYPKAKVRVGHIIKPLDATGSIHVNVHFDPTGTVNGTGKIGYAAGSGGSVSQDVSKNTPVTLHKTCGQITTFATLLAHDTSVSFTLTNNRIEAGDVLILNHLSGGTIGAYTLNAQCAAGSAIITIRNIIVANTSLSEAITIAFAVIRGSST